MPQIYNDPAGGNASSVGPQFRTDYYNKKALIEAKKEQFFGQLASVTGMPKNMGKTIKRYHYVPLLDDANINDQGIDAAGNTVLNEVTIMVNGVGTDENGDVPGGGRTAYFVGGGVDAATALLAAKAKVVEWASRAVASGGLGLALVAGTATDYTDLSTTGGNSAYDLGYRFSNDTAGDAVEASGNLYGSSKDIGTVASKLPVLSENGGRVNRVGFKRIELEGTIEKFGFFYEWTQESVDFDTDAELDMHLTRENVMGANEMTEDALQIDLLHGAGVTRFGGVATATSELTGEGADISIVSYEDLMRLEIDLDNNRCPKNTKIITGTRMVDTKVVDGARYMYVGSELIPTLKKMTDTFGNQAFIAVQHYAAGTTLATGEIGSIGGFRIINVPEMLHWAGAGASVGTNEGYRETGGNYDVFPMLVVGSESFNTIGFQTDGKTVKFKITTKKPGPDIANRDDPYGEIGFSSIKWYYATMILRPERIALVKVVAEW